MTFNAVYRSNAGITDAETSVVRAELTPAARLTRISCLSWPSSASFVRRFFCCCSCMVSKVLSSSSSLSVCALFLDAKLSSSSSTFTVFVTSPTTLSLPQASISFSTSVPIALAILYTSSTVRAETGPSKHPSERSSGSSMATVLQARPYQIAKATAGRWWCGTSGAFLTRSRWTFYNTSLKMRSNNCT